MALRCKPGDLVYCHSSLNFPEMVGRVFNVTIGCWKYGVWFWQTEPPQMGVPSWSPSLPPKAVFFEDSILTPIRGGEGEDEMLRIAGKPPALKEPTT